MNQANVPTGNPEVREVLLLELIGSSSLRALIPSLSTAAHENKEIKSSQNCVQSPSRSRIKVRNMQEAKVIVAHEFFHDGTFQASAAG